ncbi:MAG: thiamine pyrophosphate-binding protein [Candidatus Bathyarchaeia archaeon]
MSGARAFVKALEREGVEIFFGVSGGAVLPICDELYGSDVRFVLARHEQGAAHMADGYARASGRVGVCLATSGPGATNLVTGIATANIDSSPVVAFTGQVPTSMIGTDAFQEVDIIGVSASVTKYNIQVRGAAEIPGAIRSAFHIAFPSAAKSPAKNSAAAKTPVLPPPRAIGSSASGTPIGSTCSA